MLVSGRLHVSLFLLSFCVELSVDVVSMFFRTLCNRHIFYIAATTRAWLSSIVLSQGLFFYMLEFVNIIVIIIIIIILLCLG